MNDEADDLTWPDFDHGFGSGSAGDADPLAGQSSLDGEFVVDADMADALDDVVSDMLEGEITLDEAVEEVQDIVGEGLADGTDQAQDVEVETVAEGGDGVPVYEVQSGDNLWNIAEEHLGDGSRWPEIADLNPDLISDPDLIQPGWQLELPGDAVGVERVGADADGPVAESASIDGGAGGSSGSDGGVTAEPASFSEDGGSFGGGAGGGGEDGGSFGGGAGAGEGGASGGGGTGGSDAGDGELTSTGSGGETPEADDGIFIIDDPQPVMPEPEPVAEDPAPDDGGDGLGLDVELTVSTENGGDDVLGIF